MTVGDDDTGISSAVAISVIRVRSGRRRCPASTSGVTGVVASMAGERCGNPDRSRAADETINGDGACADSGGGGGGGGLRVGDDEALRTESADGAAWVVGAARGLLPPYSPLGGMPAGPLCRARLDKGGEPGKDRRAPRSTCSDDDGVSLRGSCPVRAESGGGGDGSFCRARAESGGGSGCGDDAAGGGGGEGAEVGESCERTDELIPLLLSPRCNSFSRCSCSCGDDVAIIGRRVPRVDSMRLALPRLGRRTIEKGAEAFPGSAPVSASGLAPVSLRADKRRLVLARLGDGVMASGLSWGLESCCVGDEEEF